MRGKAFHNQIAVKAKMIFSNHGWQVYTEYRRCKNDTTTYFDLFAIKGDHKLACEIETTARHAHDNVIKAKAVGIEVWIVVPSRKLLHQIKRKLKPSKNSTPVMLLCQLKTKLAVL